MIDGYTLLFAALLLSAGSIADRVGAKRALGLGIVGFAVASVGCTAAANAADLIAARCLQGAAAAVILPASMALVRAAYPDPRRRARALGIWAVGGAVAALVGQPLGGLLTTVDWRWVFTINVPVCLAMLAGLLTVARSPTRRSSFDWAGQALAVLALSALVFGLIDGGHHGFTAPVVVSALALAAVGLAAFMAVEARARHPMMPLGLFRATGFRIALAVGFAFMVANYGSVFVTSLFLQQRLGMSPLRAGLVFLPAAVFAIAGNLSSGRVTNAFGPRLPIFAGQLLIAAGLVVLVVTAHLGSPLAVSVSTIPIGAGGALAMPAVTAVVLAGVDADLAGTASALFNTFRQVGGAVAIAVFGALVGTPQTFLHGLRVSFLTTAFLLTATATLSTRIGRTADTR